MSDYQLKCNECGTLNRIPAAKEGIPGHCGNCRAELPALYLRPQQITEQSFERFIAGYPGPVLAEFWAPW